MKARSLNIESATRNKLFYFVATTVVYRRDDSRCLIMKRDNREKVHPGKWGILGGKLEWSDLDLTQSTRMNGEVHDFFNIAENLLAREALEEANIHIEKDIHYIKSLGFVRPDGIPVVMIEFACAYESGNVIPEKGSFTDFAWVNDKEVKTYDCIEGIKDEVNMTISIFKDLA